MPSTSEIGYFRVTNRNAEESLGAMVESAESQPKNPMEVIDKTVPENGNMVIVGSGLGQNVAQAINEKRPDINVVSIDPTLGLDEEKFYTISKEDENKKLESVQYIYETEKKEI